MNGLFDDLFYIYFCRRGDLPMADFPACNGIGYNGGQTPCCSGKYLRNFYSGYSVLPDVYNIGTLYDIYAK